MAIKIRLRQQGRTNRPFYRVVVADMRTRRDGKYIEALGWYNPFETELDKSLSLNAERIQYWLSTGAQLSETMIPLLKKTSPGILRHQTNKSVAHRAKAATKRKARKQAAA